MDTSMLKTTLAIAGLLLSMPANSTWDDSDSDVVRSVASGGVAEAGTRTFVSTAGKIPIKVKIVSSVVTASIPIPFIGAPANMGIGIILDPVELAKDDIVYSGPEGNKRSSYISQKRKEWWGKAVKELEYDRDSVFQTGPGDKPSEQYINKAGLVGDLAKSYELEWKADLEVQQKSQFKDIPLSDIRSTDLMAEMEGARVKWRADGLLELTPCDNCSEFDDVIGSPSELKYISINYVEKNSGVGLEDSAIKDYMKESTNNNGWVLFECEEDCGDDVTIIEYVEVDYSAYRNFNYEASLVDVNVVDISNYESNTLKKWSEEFDRDNDRIMDEVGAIDTGVTSIDNYNENNNEIGDDELDELSEGLSDIRNNVNRYELERSSRLSQIHNDPKRMMLLMNTANEVAQSYNDRGATISSFDEGILDRECPQLKAAIGEEKKILNKLRYEIKSSSNAVKTDYRFKAVLEGERLHSQALDNYLRAYNENCR